MSDSPGNIGVDANCTSAAVVHGSDAECQEAKGLIGSATFDSEAFSAAVGGLVSGTEKVSISSERGSVADRGSNVAVLRGAVVTARGTGDGLTLRLDARVPEEVLRKALWSFIESRESFLHGNSVAFEWVGGEPEDEFVESLKRGLKDEFQLCVSSSEVQEPAARLAGLMEKVSTSETFKSSTKSLTRSFEATSEVGLFSGVSSIAGLDSEATGAQAKGASLAQRARSLFSNKPSVAQVAARQSTDITTTSTFTSSSSVTADMLAFDEPDARVVCRTVRSGQKIETEHSLIVVGDVNTGSELIAGGDIIVLGHLRGVAHAGAYEESGGGRFIMALQLEPSQLRIGSVISRGEAGGKATCAEIARVDGSLIVVEPYLARNVVSKLKK